MNRKQVTDVLDGVPADAPVLVEYRNAFGERCVRAVLSVRVARGDDGFTATMLCRDRDGGEARG